MRIKEHINHVPIGIMKDVFLKRDVTEGSVVSFNDIEILDGLALTAWRSIEKRIVES